MSHTPIGLVYEAVHHQISNTVAQADEALREASLALARGSHPAPGDTAREVAREAFLRLTQACRDLVEATTHEPADPRAARLIALIQADPLMTTRVAKKRTVGVTELQNITRALRPHLATVPPTLNKAKTKELRNAFRAADDAVASHYVNQARDYLDAVERLAKRSAALAEGQDPEKRDLIAITQLVHEVVKPLVPWATDRMVEFRYAGERPGDYLVHAQRALLRQALDDVIHNAVKYSGRMTNNRRSWIDISFGKSGNDVVLSVESWGTPILDSEIASGAIFKQGVRGELVADSGQPGQGRGLAFVKYAVEANDGRIEIKSVINKQPVLRAPRPGKKATTTVMLVFPAAA